jgi:hypothetical protein
MDDIVSRLSLSVELPDPDQQSFLPSVEVFEFFNKFSIQK